MKKRSIVFILALIIMGALTLGVLAACTEVNIDHLEIYSAPKTQYYLGEAFDLDGARILVSYVNGQEELVDVTPSMVSDFDSSVLGTQYIKIYYGNASVTVQVEVIRRSITTVELEIPTDNYDHVQGQNLKTEGSNLIVTYADGSVETIPVTADMCTGYDRNVIGQQSITVTATIGGETVTAMYAVNVREREISRIEITAAPSQNVYYLGDEEVDLTGGELFVTYTNGYSERFQMISGGVLLTGLRVQSFDSTVINPRSPVTLEYYGFTASFNVSVQERNVASYEFLSPVPEQLQGTPFDWGDAAIRITYTNDTTVDIELPNEDYVEISGYVPSEAGTQSVTLIFKYGTATLQYTDVIAVTVNARSVTGLEIVSAPAVYEDTVFDISEFTYRLVYDNGEYGEPVPLTTSMVVWQGGVATDIYDEPGEVTWLIRQGETELEYVFNVEELEAESLTFYNTFEGGAVAVVYRGGAGDIGFGDVEVEVTYNSGNSERARIDDIANISGGTFDLVYDESAPLGYAAAEFVFSNEYEAAFAADVSIIIARAVSAVDITVGDEFDAVQPLGGAFDPTGLRVEVTYAGGGSDVFTEFDAIFYNAWSFVPSSDDLAYETVFDGTATRLIFGETGVYTITLSNRGISDATVFSGNIAVNVTNLPVSINGMYRDEFGTEAVDTASPAEFSVPTGATITLEDIWIEVVYEGMADGVNLREFVPMTDPRVEILYNPRDHLEPGTFEVPFTFTESGVTIEDSTFMVTITARSLVAIEADVTNMDTEYVRGENLSFAGLSVNLVYNNGTRVAIADINAALQSGTLSYSGYSALETGVQTVTLQYMYYENVDGIIYTYTLTDDFDVTVSEPAPVAVSWVSGSTPETELFGGAPFDLTRVYVISSSGYNKRLIDQSVRITYSDGTFRTVLLEEILDEVTVDESSFSLDSSVRQSPRLIYGGVEFYIYLIVAERTLQSISLNVGGITVVQEAEITTTGITINLSFSDGTAAQVPLEERYIAMSADNPNGYDSSDTRTGERNVIVYYVYENLRLETEVTVTVIAKQLVKIEIDGMPPKQNYVEHEAFEVSDSDAIRVYYSNGLSETVPMSEATVLTGAAGEVEGQFNIRLKTSAPFNNSEIDGGVTRTQKIVIDYTFSGVTAETSYLIYMRDRRTPAITFDPNNVYERVYKDENAGNGIDVTVMGYSDYDTFGEEFKPGSGKEGSRTYKLYYVGADGREYENGALPVDAGEYTVVVYYAGDAVHNKFEDRSRTLVINKRSLTLTFAPDEFEYNGMTVSGKVYGQEVPDVRVTASGFAEGEDFDDLYSTGHSYSTPAIVKNLDGEETVYIFNYAYFSGSSAVDMTANTAAGTYSLRFAEQNVSDNYEILYQTRAYTVAARLVTVTTESVSSVYGATETAIPVYASAAEGVAESGLVEGDTLRGALLRENYNSEYTVGDYIITVGTLRTMNPNYAVLFTNDDEWYSITERTVYVQVSSNSKTYGEEYLYPTLGYYGDAACQDSSSAFAPLDSALTPEEILGAATFVYPGLDDKTGMASGAGYIPYYRTPAGTYTVSVKLSKDTDRAENYIIYVVNGRLEVTRRSVNVTASAAAKQYGDADPEFTYSVEAAASGRGLIEGDALSGALSRSPGEAVGEYRIIQSTLQNANYNINFVSALFTINRRSLTLSIADGLLQRVYDGRTPSLALTDADGTVAEGIALLDIDGSVFEGTSTGINGAESAARVTGYIVISFANSSRNAGSYALSVSSSSANYSITTAAAYTYVIDPLEVSAEEIDYFVTINGAATSLEEAVLSYTGEQFGLSASIQNPMPVYNADGSQATDNMNRPRFDEVFVQLDVTGVTDAGEYVVTATGFDTSNYTLIQGVDYGVGFTVSPMDVVVTIPEAGSDAEYPNTLVREYGETSLLVYTYDYFTSVDEQYDFSLPFSFDIGVTVNGAAMDVTDVQYDSDGDPVVYDIGITSAPSSGNYDIVFAEEYRFVMLPRPVVISIFDSALSKTYDGMAPSISATQFQMAEIVSNFDTSSVAFLFERIASDGRSNVSVGAYSVTILCTDTNFTVTAASPYIYTINPSSVTYTLNASALTKYYDGADIAFTESDINFGTSFTQQNMPNIRTFAYGVAYNAETGEWKFREALTVIGDSLTSLRNAFAEIDLSRPTEARSYITIAQNVLSSFRSILSNTDHNSFLSAENLGTLVTSSDSMYDELLNAYNALTSSDAAAAAAAYALAENHLNSITEAYFDENSYIAFVVGNEETMAISEVTADSGLPVTAVANDYNMTFTMSNLNPTVRIQPRRFEIHIADITVEYGQPEQTIDYSVFDVMSGLYLELEDIDAEGRRTYRYVPDNGTRLYIAGTPTREPGTNRGTYQINTDDIHIYTDDGYTEYSSNYSLTPGTGENMGAYNITRANIVLAFGEDGVLDIGTVYGDQINQSALINAANSSMRVVDGELASGEDLFSVVDFSGIQYYCEVNGNNIIGSVASTAGSPTLTATLPASASTNYSITIQPGSLLISKATLSLSYAVSGANRVEKTYGDTLTMDWFRTNLTYSGFRLGDTINSVRSTSGALLSEIVWPYISFRRGDEGEVAVEDPFLPTAPVALTATDPVLISFSDSEGYIFDNYEISFEGTEISVVITRKDLVLNVLPASGSSITTYYKGTPPVSSYTFGYSGFVNDETAESLGIQSGENAPVLLALMNGSNYLNAGSYTLGAANVDYDQTQAALANYALSVSAFNVTIDPIPVTVRLTDGINVLYTFDGAGRTYQLMPYAYSFVYESVRATLQDGVYVPSPDGKETIYIIDRESVLLSEGQYGVEDFIFGLGVSEEILAFHGITISDADAYIDSLKSAFVKYSYSDMLAERITTPGHYNGIEYFDYANLYVHDVVEGTPTRQPDGSYIASCTLRNMETGSGNYTFVYESFDVNVVSAVVLVLASLNETLLTSDIATYLDSVLDGRVTDEDFLKVIYFYAMNSFGDNEVVYGDGETANTALADGITIEIAGETEYRQNITYLLKAYYEKTVKLDDALSMSYITAHPFQYMIYTEGSNGNYTPSSTPGSVSVDSDRRMLTYDASDEFAMLPVRFRDTSTAGVVNPTDGPNSDSIGGYVYGSTISSSGLGGYFTSSEVGDYDESGNFEPRGAFDSGYFELRAAPAAREAGYVELLINGTGADGLFMRFSADSYNGFELVYYSGGSVRERVTYEVPYGRFFDGAVHTVRFELSKDGYTFIASVDGYTGALLDLTTALDAYYDLGSSARVSPFNENSAAGFRLSAVNGFVLRRAEYYTVGRYSDKRGILATLRENATPVAVSAGQSDYFTLTGIRLADLFGLDYVFSSTGGGTYSVPEGYQYIFYVDGVQAGVEEDAAALSVALASGRHLIEVALYAGGTLVDIDSVVLDVVSAYNTDGVMVIRMSDTGADEPDDPSEYIFDGTEVIDFYDRDTSYSGQNVSVSNSAEYMAYMSAADGVRYNYLETLFMPERTAVASDSGAVYPAYASGAELLNIGLFSITHDIYDSIALVFTLVQAEEQAVTAPGEYTLRAGLYYTVNYAVTGDALAVLYEETLTGTALPPVFSLKAFVDRNTSDYFGSGSMVVMLGTDGGAYSCAVIEDPGASLATPSLTARLGYDVDSGSSAGLVTLTSAAHATLTLYDVSMSIGLPDSDTDFVKAGADNTYTYVSAASGQTTLANGETMYISETGTLPAALRHNGVSMSFADTTDGVMRLYLSISGLDPEAEGARGAYLEFDFAANTRTFRFYMNLAGGGTRLSVAQTVSLPTLAEGVDVYSLDISYATNVQANYASMRHVSNILFGEGSDAKLIAEATTNAPVYALPVTVTLNGDETVFYCPLLADNMGSWRIDDGSTFGANPYGSMTDLAGVPSFIGYIGAVGVSYSGSGSVDITEFGAYLGVDNSDHESGITDTPAI